MCDESHIRSSISGVRDDAEDGPHLNTNSAARVSLVPFRVEATTEEILVNHTSTKDALQKKIARFRHWWNRQDRWQIQIISWVISFALIVCIIIIVRAYDGEKLPQWRHNITLNTIIAVLAIISTFALMVPVTAGLGQVKWIRFRTSAHRLSEFDMIDRASRGPAGSIALLLKGQGGYLAVMGSLISLAVLALSPFLQQLIHYDIRPEPTSNGASIPISVNFAAEAPDPNISDPGTTNTVAAAMFAGLYATSTTTFQVEPTCLSNNCTWDEPYQSLAMCSECKDISNMVKHYHDVIDMYALPNGLSVPDGWYNIGNAYVVKDWGSPGSLMFESIAFADHGLVAIDLFSLYKHENDTAPAVAYECVLQFCVKSYTAKVTDGVFDEKLHEQWVNNTLNVQELTALYRRFGHIENIPLLLTPSGHLSSYTIGLWEAFSIVNWGRTHLFLKPHGYNDFNAGLTTAIQNPSIVALEAIVSNIAAAFTYHIRSTYGSVAPGTNYVMETFVQVQYAWLTLPVFLQLIVLVFLVILMVRSSTLGVETWKDNGLAVLFHGLDEGTAARLGLLTRVDIMDEVAEELIVKMKVGDHGLRLSPYEQ